MSNIVNIGWEPLQLMMRDLNNVPDEFKHLPFTDEVNQLLLSALSSGEHVQNNYYGVDSTYYRSRYGPSVDPSPSNVYSNSQPTANSSLSPPQPNTQMPPQQQQQQQQQQQIPSNNKPVKLQPPSIQLPSQPAPTNCTLSPRLLQNQYPQMPNMPQPKPQAQMPIPQQQQQQQSGRYQQQQQQSIPKNQIPNQMQVPQQMPMQQQQQQNQEAPRTSLQAQLLQHLQHQRQQAQAQQPVQVKQQSNPSPPQSHSRPPSPTQIPLRPPSPPDLVQQQRHVSPSRQHLVPSHLMVPPQISSGYMPVPMQYPSSVLHPHMANSHVLSQPHLMNMQQLSSMQQQQYQQQIQTQAPQLQQQQPTQPVPKSSVQVPPAQVQPTQTTQSQPQAATQSQPQTQTTQSQSQPSQAQQSQLMRAMNQSPSNVPLDPLSPTVYQFINVKDESDPNKSKPLTEKQKNRRRASQNLASRNYRQRKKEYINAMEDRTQELERMNEQLRRQVNQKEVIISKLSTENTTLRANANLAEANHSEDLEDADSPIDANMQDLIFRLERTIKLEKVDTDAEAEATGLKSTLNAFYGSLQDRHDRYTNQVKEIVNPCTQAKLSALDSDPTSPFDNGFTENDDGWWESFSDDADISDEQEAKIKEIRRDHYVEFQRLRTERRTLNKDIRDYYKMVFSSAIGGAEEIEADVGMEELVGKLNALKQNLEDEKRLILETHKAMSKVLTAKQEAMLVTRSYNKVVRSNATIQMVTNMYEVVLKENALAKCCAPGWEVL